MVASSSTLRIGTRGSRLALWQAKHVASSLSDAWPGMTVEILTFTTKGDQILDVVPSALGDKGLFTRELEEALLQSRIDLAVHSLKDLPTEAPAGLSLAAITKREDPRDVLVSSSGRRLLDLSRGARLGTASLRRRAQALSVCPDIEVVDLRGNVPTRLSKLDRGDCDAIVLARAGLLRLGLENRVTEVLEPVFWLPAVGQGALAIEARSDDERTQALVDPLEDREARLCTTAERALLACLEGGCQVPLGALATLSGEALTLDAQVSSVDGTRRVRLGDTSRVERGPAGLRDAAALGQRLAQRLLRIGAAEILADVRQHSAVDPSLAMVAER